MDYGTYRVSAVVPATRAQVTGEVDTHGQVTLVEHAEKPKCQADVHCWTKGVIGYKGVRTRLLPNAAGP